MREAGLTPGVDTYSTLIDAAVETGGSLGRAEALQLMRGLQAAGLQPDAVVWTTLMKLYQRQVRHAVCVAKRVGWGLGPRGCCLFWW